MSANHQISCRLYLDGKYMPLLDEDGEIWYAPNAAEQDALNLAIQHVIEKGDLLGDKEVLVDFFDNKDIILSYGPGTTPFPQPWLDTFLGKSFRIYPRDCEQGWGPVFVEFVPFDSPTPKGMPAESRTDALKALKQELRLLKARVDAIEKNIADMESMV